nr:MAG TPA: hypothetical protein [Caudoviricetes sp.]
MGKVKSQSLTTYQPKPLLNYRKSYTIFTSSTLP